MAGYKRGNTILPVVAEGKRVREPTVIPYYHKVFCFGWGETGKVSSMAAYRREETSSVELSHIQERRDGTMLLWLKSFGTVKWYIETNEVATVIKKYGIRAPEQVKIIRDIEYTH